MARDLSTMYKEKLCSAEEAVKSVNSGDRLDFVGFNGKPIECDKALAARKNELSDVRITSAVCLPPVPETVLKDPKGEVFTFNDFHFSPLSRILQEQTNAFYYCPVVFAESEDFYWSAKKNDPENRNDPDKIGTGARSHVFVQTTPMDKDGFFNWGIHNAHTLAMTQSAQKVVVEINENLPWVYGGNSERIHISEVDAVVEGKHPPLTEMPSAEASETDKKIANHILEYMRDGDCVQLGIGSMPNVLGKMINDSDLKDLGGWTEMLVDTYYDLWESGKMNGRKKNIDSGRINFTFALGSQKLYDWVDRNIAVATCSVNYVNNVQRIGEINNMISINQALQVDLYSQVNAESSGFRQVSGNGGMSDFVQGAFWSQGGRSFICLPSTHSMKDGTLVSNIVASFDTGSIVTITRHMVQFIVTEYGAVNMKTCSTWERAEKLISVAHPDFRDDLIKEAEKRKIWRRTSKIA